MDKLLLHSCCAPCSVYCVDTLRADGIEPTSLWFNPNIHPWTEYDARRRTLLEYGEKEHVEVHILEDYGLRDFVRAVSADIDHRCAHCYTIRLGTAAKYAADHGYDAFTSSLLISPYQNHELLKAVGETMGKQYGVEFYYRDFRPGFREGQAKAREMGLYMQKYCGCIFSEEDRYSTKIEKAKKRYAEE
ncbi:epoxyqueuosine reductase QueH [Hominicoprocola fusiformis]